MAYGSNISLSCAKVPGWTGRIEWEYSQSILLNTTTITVKVVSHESKAGLVSGKFYGYISISGKQFPFYFDNETTDYSQKASFKAEIRHNGSGRLEKCVIKCEILDSSEDGGNTLSGEADVATSLPRIQTDSDFDSIDDILFGERCSISWTPESSSYYYKLQFSFENQTSGVLKVKPGSITKYTYSGFTIPLSWASEIPTSSYGFVTVTMTPYSDSALTKIVGRTSSATFTVTLGQDIVPTIDPDTLKLILINDSIPDVFSEMAISGYTKVKISAEASGVYGSSVKSFKVAGPDSAVLYNSSLDYTSKEIRISGETYFTVTCVDSRGRSSSEYKTNSINFIKYSEPNVFYLSIDRQLKDGKVVFFALPKWEISSVDNKNNVSSAILQYKESTSLDWTDYRTDSGSIYNFLNGEKVELSINVDDEISYDFRIVVTDTLGKIGKKEAFSSSKTVLLDFRYGGKGLGIGKTCEKPEGGLEVGMPAYFDREIYVRRDNTHITIGEYIESFIDPLSCISLTIPPNLWTSQNGSGGGAPYFAKIKVTGMTSDRNYAPPFLVFDSSFNLEELQAARVALSCIDGGITELDYVTLYCYEDKPTVSINIRMQGVI